MSKNKGYRGEVEVLALLSNAATMEYRRRGVPPPELNRSANGRDIQGLSWLAPEVKRHEKSEYYNIDAWWEQTKAQAVGGREPVLFYRKNNQPWNVRMFGQLPTAKANVRCPVDITLQAFMVWFQLKLEESLGG